MIMSGEDEFAQFEHEGWERVAERYDSVWSSLTRQFVPHLINAAQVAPGMSILDVACGPGYVSAAAASLGAKVTGIDFSRQMIAIAGRMFPEIQFIEADAQQLPFPDASFNRVLMNFGLLHLSEPEKACAEAFRVLRPGGKFAFTVWAQPPHNPGGRIVNDAIEAHADLNVQLPAGPPYHLFSDEAECRNVLGRVGFNAASMVYETSLVEWDVPTSQFLFEAERDAGVRTAGLLARQTSQALDAIMRAIEDGVRPYAKGEGFAIPMAAHVIDVSRN